MKSIHLPSDLTERVHVARGSVPDVRDIEEVGSEYFWSHTAHRAEGRRPCACLRRVREVREAEVSEPDVQSIVDQDIPLRKDVIDRAEPRNKASDIRCGGLHALHCHCASRRDRQVSRVSALQIQYHYRRDLAGTYESQRICFVPSRHLRMVVQISMFHPGRDEAHAPRGRLKVNAEELANMVVLKTMQYRDLPTECLFDTYQLSCVTTMSDTEVPSCSQRRPYATAVASGDTSARP